MGWGSFLKSTLRLGGRMTSATAHTVGSAVLHPQQTLKGVGSATKSAVVGGSLGYIGWEKLTTDKSVVGIAAFGRGIPLDADFRNRGIFIVAHRFDRLTDLFQFQRIVAIFRIDWRHRIRDWRWRERLERLSYRTFRQRKWGYQQRGFQVERYVWLPQSHVLWSWR